MATTTGFYVAIGLLCATYFGSHLSASVNLNWTDFFADRNSSRIYSVLTACLSNFIVLFPAIDTLSVFPLIAITLGNSLVLASGADASSVTPRRRLLSRLFAAIPPCILGYLVQDLSWILHFSGLFGLNVVFIVPALLHFQSSRFDPLPCRCSLRALPFRSDSLVFAVLGVAAVACVVLTSQFLQQTWQVLSFERV